MANKLHHIFHLVLAFLHMSVGSNPVDDIGCLHALIDNGRKRLSQRLLIKKTPIETNSDATSVINNRAERLLEFVSNHARHLTCHARLFKRSNAVALSADLRLQSLILLQSIYQLSRPSSHKPTNIETVYDHDQNATEQCHQPDAITTPKLDKTIF